MSQHQNLLTINYLNSGKTLDDLKNEHFVEASAPTNGKISLNYMQIEADNTDPISNECRGLIISSKNGIYYPVAVPFFRFFNFGQTGAAISSEKDILSSKIYEKLDGTLGIVYFDSEKWCIATRSVPEADLKYNDFTFDELFRKCIDFENLTNHLDKDVTYMFEIMTPYNEVVVRHNDFKVVLLGARNTLTLQEIEIDDLDIPVEKVKTYTFASMDDLKDYLSKLSPDKGEGFVVKTKDFKRVKIKSLNYVMAHRLVSKVGVSKRNMLHAILLGQDDDLQPIVNKFIWNDILEIKEKFIELNNNLDSIFDSIKHIESQKDYALEVNGKYKKYSSYLFNMRKGLFMKDIIKKGISDSFLDNILSLMY